MPTAFVAGATGYTGREVVRALVARQVRTVAHVRADSPRLGELRREFESEGAEVDVTQWDEKELASTFSRLRVDVVFALLGTTRARARAAEREGKDASYEAVDYGLTVLLLRALEKASSDRRPKFVYLSALGADRPRNAYYEARYKAEREIMSCGLPYVVARPSFITGPDRAESRAGERVAVAAIDGALGILSHLGGTRLRDRFASMTARELAQSLVTLGLDGSEVATVAGPERLQALRGA